MRALLLNLADRGLDQVGPIPPHYIELFRILIGAVPIPFELQGDGRAGQLMRHLQPLYLSIEENLAERCFFTTNEGLMGVGPYDTRQGDMVVVFFGCAMDSVVRSCGRHGGEHWELIGDAYVQGFMSGQAVGEYEMGLREAFDFELC